MSPLIKVNEKTFKLLKELEAQMGISVESILHQAIDTFYRDKIIQDINSYYEELKKDPQMWQEELEERALWETASNDGLEDE